jgi:hypothetical protein
MERLIVYIYDPYGNLYQKIVQLEEDAFIIYDAYEEVMVYMQFSFETLFKYLEMVQKRHRCKIEIEEVEL